MFSRSVCIGPVFKLARACPFAVYPNMIQHYILIGGIVTDMTDRRGNTVQIEDNLTILPLDTFKC